MAHQIFNSGTYSITFGIQGAYYHIDIFQSHQQFVAFYQAICLCLTLCHFGLVFLSPFSIAITSLGEERANLSALRTFVQFMLLWICRFPLPLGVWKGLRFVIVALPGLFSYLFFQSKSGEIARYFVFCSLAFSVSTAGFVFTKI